MSIGSMMSTSLSALQANQRALNTVSTNVANVNTEGYTRLDTNFNSRSTTHASFGIEVEVARAADKFLAASEMRTSATVGSAEVVSGFMDRVQGLFGDPSQSGTVFASIDKVFASAGSLALDPSSSLRQGSVISDLQNMLGQINQTAHEITALQDEANGQLRSVIGEANTLMETIADLNASIQQSKIAGVDATQAENEQSKLIDRLSQIVDIRTQERSLGGVDVRTTNGYLLVSHEAANFSMGETSGLQGYPSVEVSHSISSTKLPLDKYIQSGEIMGLIQARDVEIPELGTAFGEYAAGVIDALNAEHNNASAVPAPGVLTGENNGLISSDIHGFSGVAHMAVTNSSGQVVRNLEIDFDAGNITDHLGATTAIGTTVGNLVTALNTALGADGGATFTNGVLEISAANAAGGDGIAVRQDEDTPSDWAGRGLSHMFGLNNIVEKPTPTNFATGLDGASPHGFTTGQTMTLDIKSSNGTILNTVTVAPTTGGTVNDLVTQMNTSLSGYGTISYDNQTGRMSFQGTGSSRADFVDMVTDTTSRTGSNLSVTQMFGLSQVGSSDRAKDVVVREDILNNYSLLATAKPELDGAAVGASVLEVGDGRGITALSLAGDTIREYGAVGGMNAQSTSVNDFAARLAGVAGARSTASQQALSSAESVKNEVSLRRESVEGVNVDEELVKMTQYQQAYNSASRMMQAASEMFDTLLNMV
ncbi:flagellar hook-associated protein FlgK [Hirschia maritima]|uniref:flagellar hook-associated protein FlgK n=1 Tax=Hirschia maritima TaxID=1121961 RepID=UPI000380234C|nr:flagellar hook-associated protein FlgK [Hirschia maritima]